MSTTQHQPATETRAPRKRRRVFLWVFLTIQLVFVIWLVAGLASAGASIHSDTVAYCHAHPDAYLSFKDCVSLYGGASKAGTGIGAALVVVTWVVMDFLLTVTYGVYRLARRPQR